MRLRYSFVKHSLFRTFVLNQRFWSRRAGEPGVSLAIERGGNGENEGRKEGRLGFWGAKEKKKGGGRGASVLLFPDDRSKNELSLYFSRPLAKMNGGSSE